MALTATASKYTFDVVIKRLSMVDPVVIGISPDRSNIFLSVRPYLNLAQLADKVSTELKALQKMTPKTVIYCQSFTCCYQLYDSIRCQLQNNFTFPSGYPDLHQFRLVEMFHSGCTVQVRDKILKTFTDILSNVRVVIATSSFGMGIDCPDIRRIVHWGTPDSVEQYVQEVGRAGRDNTLSEAVLLPHRHHTISETMLTYTSNATECRRKILFQSFLFYSYSEYVGSFCCDICTPNHKAVI